ncbi:hypothetical protein ABT061_10400 [Streptosporangium sp. NPDC002544]|uniref:hypothetical protein n=1 Tax=Streptosporangium sp. NPDC002544 TaxID=3154538 RepID=UPI0033187A23
MRSSNCAGEATARTKRELIEVALLRHFEQLTDRAHAFVADTDPTVAWSVLLRTVIETGVSKLTLAPPGGRPRRVLADTFAASNRLKAAVSEVPRRGRATRQIIGP